MFLLTEMKIRIFTLLLLCLSLTVQAQLPTTFEASKGTQTPTYEEGMAWWKQFVAQSDRLKMYAVGPTDSGDSLHLVVWGENLPESWKELGEDSKPLLLINNGIHPGEPDGVDASMLLLNELISNKKRAREYAGVRLALIPFYNIGGAKNRNSHSRANQNGPEAYGFRGNARNFDLNRDFIKLDTRNAQSFARLFASLDPELYVETHVSNGADYQYTMTLLSTQHNKLGGPLGQLLHDQLEPALFAQMDKAGWSMTPYVNVWGTVPDSGMVAFNDSPRYSSGFAALHHVPAFVTETHMLKPYKDRVAATKAFLESALGWLQENGKQVQQTKKEQQAWFKQQTQWPLNWQADKSKADALPFKGYKGLMETSAVSGQPRLRYDRNQPFEKEIAFYNTFTGTDSVKIPTAYAIPQGWWPVIDRLKENGVKLVQLQQDTSLRAESYRIEDFATYERPFEGHYVHYQTKATPSLQEVQLKAGDYLAYVDQPAGRFLVEVLEPTAIDSYFNWNFFDTILQRKEGISAYVFEDVAAELLKNNPELKQQLEAKRQADPEFAKDGYAQLEFIYLNSPYYEPAHLRYPIYRLP